MFSVRLETGLEVHAAVLVENISYTNKGERFFALAGTEIVVDVSTHYALVGIHHVELDPKEYSLGLNG